MPKRYTKKLHERVRKTTSDIFETSVRHVLGLKDESIEDLQATMDFIRYASKYSGLYPESEITDMKQAKTEVDELYLKTLISLPTKDLEEILFIHQTGHIKRMPKTLEAIISEIARRSLFDDISETSNQYGELDDTRAKTSKNSKAVKRKGSQSDKG